MTISVLVLAQLPPPVHGVTVMSGHVRTVLLNMPDVRVEHRWRGGASSLQDIGSSRVRKAAGFSTLLLELATLRPDHRFDLAYLTLAPWAKSAPRDALLAGMAQRIARRTVVHVHGEGLTSLIEGPGTRTALMRRLLRGCEIIAITPGTRQEAEGCGLFSAVHDLPNFTDDPGWRPRDEGPARRPDIVCGYLGNLDPRKGILQFVDIVGAAASKGIPVSGVIAGPATPHLSHAGLREHIAAQGLADRIEIVGPVYGAAKTEFFRGLDLFIYPTRHDHAPLVLIEAMSFGAVPISLDTGGIVSIAGPQFADHILPAGADQQSTTLRARNIIKMYAEDRELLFAAQNRARARYEQAFTRGHFVDRLRSIVNDPVVGASTARRF